MKKRKTASAKRSLADRLRRVRLLALDFDGVFTDNTVYVFQDGREAVRCWRSDGLGLALLGGVGVEAVIISTEVNPVVSARARKLRLRCVQGCHDKLGALEAILRKRKLSPGQVAFVGNDINDAPCLKRVGLPIVVRDAHPDVIGLAAYRTRARGGFGAVREVCDLIVKVRSADKEVRKCESAKCG